MLKCACADRREKKRSRLGASQHILFCNYPQMIAHRRRHVVGVKPPADEFTSLWQAWQNRYFAIHVQAHLAAQVGVERILVLVTRRGRAAHQTHRHDILNAAHRFDKIAPAPPAHPGRTVGWRGDRCHVQVRREVSHGLVEERQVEIKVRVRFTGGPRVGGLGIGPARTGRLCM